MTTPATKATAAQADRLRYFEQRLIEVEAKNLGLFHTLDQLIRTVEALTDSIEAILRAGEPEPELTTAPATIGTVTSATGVGEDGTVVHWPDVDRPAGLRLVPANEPVTGYLAGLSDGAANALLRADLLTEWEANHAEHCGCADPGAKACRWPMPESLTAVQP